MAAGDSALLAPYAAQVGVWLAAILTLMVYSRLARDNPLSRLSEHLFVGTAVGYAVVIAYHQVVWPKLVSPLLRDPLSNWALLVPAVLAILLLVRPVPPLRGLASLPLALIIGVGAALAVGGAVSGSLVPQVSATMLSFDPNQTPEHLINSALVVLGVIGTVVYFYFTAKQDSVAGKTLRVVGQIGKWTMILTFGAVFATSVTARLALLIGRATFLLRDWLGVLR